MTDNRKQKITGFTITELLVVIVVISILVSITIVSYAGVTRKTIDATLQSDLSSGSKNLKMFQVENNNFPDTIRCDIADSSVNLCLRPSAGTDYTYLVNNSTNPQNFVLTATNGTSVYHITSRSSPAVGEYVAGYTGDVIPAMTSNTTPSGVVSASAETLPNYPAWKAFDDENLTPYPWHPNSFTGWLQYAFETEKVITQYTVTTTNDGTNSYPRAWTFRGSTDNFVSSNDILDTQTSGAWANNVTKTFPIDNTNAYRYYRIDVTLSQSILLIGQIEMMESSI